MSVMPGKCSEKRGGRNDTRAPVAAAMKPPPLPDSDLDAIETAAKTNAAETYRGPLLALVGEVRRLRDLL